jgi:hypothetical protein
MEPTRDISQTRGSFAGFKPGSSVRTLFNGVAIRGYETVCGFSTVEQNFAAKLRNSA